MHKTALQKCKNGSTALSIKHDYKPMLSYSVHYLSPPLMLRGFVGVEEDVSEL